MKELAYHLIQKAPKQIMQDSGKFRKNTKDQFYTNERVANTCIQTILHFIPLAKTYLWIEPAAGKGAFLHPLPPTFEKIGLDIDPKAENIISKDFLTWNPPLVLNKDILVYGNPPFGRQASMAKAFIAKSCQFAKVIAFILPKSFNKPSMFNAFDKSFHLIHSLELEKNAFLLNGKIHDVPCVFQIWERQNINRDIPEKILPKGFNYVKPPEHYDIAFRRVGGLAGKCYMNNGTQTFSIQSHYFIKFNDTVRFALDPLIDKINSHVYPNNTVGPRSISKPEVNAVLNELLDALLENTTRG